MTDDEISEWMAAALKKQGRKAQARLWEAMRARGFGWDATTTSKTINPDKNGKKRKITGAELISIAEILGIPLPNRGLRPSTDGGGMAGKVRMAGNISAGRHWSKSVDSDGNDDPMVQGLLHGSFPIDAQTAYVVTAPTDDGEYKVGDTVYTVPFPDYRAHLQKNDEVVTRHHENGFFTYSLQRAVMTDRGIGLVHMRADTSIGENTTSEVVGLVIGSSRKLHTSHSDT